MFTPAVIHARVIAAAPAPQPPLLTVAIPHYKQWRYLEVVLASLFTQHFDDFEIVVSDDASPDESLERLPAILQAGGRPFRYYRQPTNLGYDGNVRFCLAAAQGRYVMLLGNDDALANADTLTEIAAALAALQYPAVAFTNHAPWDAPEQVVRRAVQTTQLGRGPTAALGCFRALSFVSGVLFSQAAAAQFDTDAWDGSVFYQIYLGCRIIAAGGAVAGLAVTAIHKDVRIAGVGVPTYATKARREVDWRPRETGLGTIARLVMVALGPFVAPPQRSRMMRQVMQQVLLISYPYWLLEYRRVAHWSWSWGVARRLWPAHWVFDDRLRWHDRVWLWLEYVVVTVIGLVVPVSLFVRLRTSAALFVRRLQQRR